MQGKVEPDDSEAETEILSTANTPVKGRKFGHEDAPEGLPEANNMAKGRGSPVHHDSSSHGAGDTISIRRKRKVPANEAGEANGSPVWSANDEGNDDASVVHAKIEGRSRSHSRSTSSKKVARPVRKIHVGARSSDAAGAAHRSPDNSPDRSAFPHAQSPHTHFAVAHNKHLKTTRDASISSKRAATQEPRSASRSLSPPARRLHKRSSSFHSALTPAPRDKRPKTRHSDTLASQSTDARSPSVTAADTFTSDQLTPSHAAHMAGRTDKTGRTALARACEKRDVVSVKAILADSKEDLNAPDNAMNRPIQFAALQGSVEIVKLLIEAQCEVDVANSDGDTPLIDAIARGHVGIVEMLLSQNIDPNRTNKVGEAPEDFIRDDDPQRSKILALLEDARSKYISPKTGDKGKEKTIAPLDPLPTGRSRRTQHIRNDLFYVDATLQRLHEYAEKGDIEGVRHMIKCGIKADNDCAVAAASRGHREVLEYLIVWGHANCDPDPVDYDGDTPMLAAIARGHIDVIHYLLNYENFEVARKYKGKPYSVHAASLKGPRFQEAINMLTDAIADRGPKHSEEDAEVSEDEIPKRRKRLVSKKEMDASSNAGSRATERVSVEPDALSADENSTSPLPSISPASPIIPETPPEVREARDREQREAYLDTLPRAVARALTPSGRLHGRIDYASAAAETRYLKDLEDWMPIPVRRRADIDPVCAPDVSDDLYMLGVYAAVFLRLDRLDTCKAALGWDTLPVSLEQRAAMWSRHALANMLVKDHRWEDAPPAAQDSCGLPVTRWSGPGGETCAGVTWTAACEEGRKRWMELPDEQCFWVRVEDFLAEMAPGKGTPFLEGLTVRFDGRFCGGVARRVPLYRDGVAVPFTGMPWRRDKHVPCVPIG